MGSFLSGTSCGGRSRCRAAPALSASLDAPLRLAEKEQRQSLISLVKAVKASVKSQLTVCTGPDECGCGVETLWKQSC